jgi:hypothetical protein
MTAHRLLEIVDDAETGGRKLVDGVDAIARPIASRMEVP